MPLSPSRPTVHTLPSDKYMVVGAADLSPTLRTWRWHFHIAQGTNRPCTSDARESRCRVRMDPAQYPDRVPREPPPTGPVLSTQGRVRRMLRHNWVQCAAVP